MLGPLAPQGAGVCAAKLIYAPGSVGVIGKPAERHVWYRRIAIDHRLHVRQRLAGDMGGLPDAYPQLVEPGGER